MFSHNDGDDDAYICLWMIMQGKGSIRNYLGGYEALVTLTSEVQHHWGESPVQNSSEAR